MIAIIDYGMGNIHSVQKALQLFGAETVITNKPKDILSADKAVLPGVGAFDDAMLELKKRGLIPYQLTLRVSSHKKRHQNFRRKTKPRRSALPS